MQCPQHVRKRTLGAEVTILQTLLLLTPRKSLPPLGAPASLLLGRESTPKVCKCLCPTDHSQHLLQADWRSFITSHSNSCWLPASAAGAEWVEQEKLEEGRSSLPTLVPQMSPWHGVQLPGPTQRNEHPLRHSRHFTVAQNTAPPSVRPAARGAGAARVCPARARHTVYVRFLGQRAHPHFRDV